MMFFRFMFLALLLFAAAPRSATCQTLDRRTTIAILSFGDSNIGQQASDSLANNLRSLAHLQIFNPAETRAAAIGAGYGPSLNMPVSEARTFGSVLGSDFYIVGDAQTLRRSPSTGAIYYDSYASVFLVSSRSGRLISWQRISFQAPTPAGAEELLLAALSHRDLSGKLSTGIRRAQDDERNARESAIEKGIPVIEEAPEDEKTAAADGMRLPRPYRRLQPVYPETAAQAEAEAVVDVLVDLDAEGDVTRAEIARWAGFGLDEATLDTVRKLNFFPAMRNGAAIPLRVLLRYNFRKPPK